jgi:hypothetical protein
MEKIGRGVREGVHILERQALVARRYLEGASQYSISVELGYERSTITRDLMAIRRRWMQQAQDDFEAVIAKQLAKIDWMEDEATTAWLRSKAAREVSSGETVTGDTDRKKVAVRKEGQTGDDAYMRTIQWCIEKRLEIRGFAPVKRVALTDPSGEKEFTGGGLGRSSPVAALLVVAREAVDRLGGGASQAIDDRYGGQPAAVDPADGPADPGISEPGG